MTKGTLALVDGTRTVAAVVRLDGRAARVAHAGDDVRAWLEPALDRATTAPTLRATRVDPAPAGTSVTTVEQAVAPDDARWVDAVGRALQPVAAAHGLDVRVVVEDT